MMQNNIMVVSSSAPGKICVYRQRDTGIILNDIFVFFYKKNSTIKIVIVITHILILIWQVDWTSFERVIAL
jgi:hypothetical protein